MVIITEEELKLKLTTNLEATFVQSHVKNNIMGGIYLACFWTLMLRWSVSMYSYSGQNTPPMYGDYEAQRHWMEITYNLPVTQWYENSTDNDLLYWGLDYPPLTAYHSYLSGWIFSIILPKSVELHTSRGYESDIHKFLMRLSVSVSDMLFYYPSIYLYFKSSKPTDLSREACVYLALSYPGLILIDHGHFQYNCISLGLFVFSVYFISKNYNILASLAFVCAVNYKQMELYHSLPFFFYFLGKFVHHIHMKQYKYAVKMLSSVSITVLITFFIIWYPFLHSIDTLCQVVGRLFPVSRGIFEDKVSNFWCMVNVVYKLRSKFSNELLLKICTNVTLASVLPSTVFLLSLPYLPNFHLSLINFSLSFFLFSFQVHEKSILLVSIPVLLYMQYGDSLICFWFLFISTFSMVPLLIKDGLFSAFILLAMINYLAFIALNNTTNNNNNTITFNAIYAMRRHFHIRLFYISVYLCFIFAFICRFVKPPSTYPDLWPLLISAFSFAHFFAFLIYFNYKQFLYFKSNQKKIIPKPHRK